LTKYLICMAQRVNTVDGVEITLRRKNVRTNNIR